ncbi:MAG: septum formation initiator family protein [Patescibacteria group bacterium]
MPDGVFKSIVFSKSAIAVLTLLVVVFGVYTSRAVLTKRATEAQIAALSADIASLEHEKDSLGELIEYVQTDSFIREEAREKLNLTDPGESLVVIPDIDSQGAQSGADAESGLTGPKGTVLGDANLVLWWEYFFDPASGASQPE